MNPGLDAFLYADVGAEANGSTLTVLSILARLGKDPWAEAARWGALPNAMVIDSLAQSIAQMPLAPPALAGARGTASRLVQLLPANARVSPQGPLSKAEAAKHKLLPATLLYLIFTIGMALNLILAPKQSPDVPSPMGQPMATLAATHSTSAPLPTVAAIAR